MILVQNSDTGIDQCFSGKVVSLFLFLLWLATEEELSPEIHFQGTNMKDKLTVLGNFPTFSLFIILSVVSLAISQWNETPQAELNAFISVLV